MGGDNVSTLVEIGLTDLPKTGKASLATALLHNILIKKLKSKGYVIKTLTSLYWSFKRFGELVEL